ncbi:lymphocyte antigen 75-like [Boleophthalmus pectinirostris]|uniref:lymphocyte antigen 75-like n=1 Tax=Boleophthalmus pectinirostris TaxID=150288 RepID=UPI00242D1170|nr:lymphocyte antigen 75-like [Boleophthalmus pectinirostris]
MEALFLLTVGSLALAPVSSRHFVFVYELKTQEEARSYCRQHYTDLATVENMEDVLTLNDGRPEQTAAAPASTRIPQYREDHLQRRPPTAPTAHSADRPQRRPPTAPTAHSADRLHSSSVLSSLKHRNRVQRTWIGLYDDVNTWSWSLSDPTYYSEGQENYRNWDPGQPDNNGANQFCAWISSIGLWKDFKCHYGLRAICVNLTGSSETFVLTNASFTWEEAQQYCRQHHTDLASVKDATQNSQIAALIPTGYAWIGLRRQPWRWLDGNNSTFSFWKTLQPDNYEKLEHCVVADFESGGRWEDSNCDKMRPFICYVRPVKKYKIKLQLNTTTANLNDPVVMEQLLQQIALHVGRANATDLLKLSWVKDANGNVFNKTTTP